MANILTWFNGRKTAIGMVLLLAAQGIELLATPGSATTVVQILNWIGAALGATGVAHKVAKREL